MEKQKRRWIRPAVHREGGKLLGSSLRAQWGWVTNVSFRDWKDRVRILFGGN